MLTCHTPSRRFRIARASTLSLLAVVLFAAPYRAIGAQVTALGALTDWRAWAFGRVGPAQTSLGDTHGRSGAVLGSLAGGIGVSYGRILGMVRVADTEDWSFRDSRISGTRDDAVLAGLRSRGDRLFVAGAVGLAQAMPGAGIGTASPGRPLVPAYDLSAHADYHVVGLALTASGVLGPANTRYLALSLGVEAGWFGFK